MRFSVMHDGVPVGSVELASGEFVAGPLAPLPALDPLRETIRAGSDALLALGFFGAAAAARQNGAGEALRAAAALHFDLVNGHGELTPATFVNVLESPDGGLVALVRFAHSHSIVTAPLAPLRRQDSAHSDPGINEPDV